MVRRPRPRPRKKGYIIADATMVSEISLKNRLLILFSRRKTKITLKNVKIHLMGKD